MKCIGLDAHNMTFFFVVLSKGGKTLTKRRVKTTYSARFRSPILLHMRGMRLRMRLREGEVTEFGVGVRSWIVDWAGQGHTLPLGQGEIIFHPRGLFLRVVGSPVGVGSRRTRISKARGIRDRMRRLFLPLQRPDVRAAALWNRDAVHIFRQSHIRSHIDGS